MHWSYIFLALTYRFEDQLTIYEICSTQSSIELQLINILRLRQNGRHFPDDIFKCILLYENVWISLKISLKFVPEVRINNIPALVQIMAWCRPGNKPLSESMMVSLPTHKCVIQPQWVNWMSGYQDASSSNGYQVACLIQKEWILAINI